MVDLINLFDGDSGISEILVKKEADKLVYTPIALLNNPSSATILSDPIRIEILRLLSKSSMYPAEIARHLGMHEQKVYYHIKQLMNSGIISVTSRQEIRGTTAKKYSAKALNYAFCLDNAWKDLNLGTMKIDKKMESFLTPFINNGVLDADIVVGSPDPHGPFKARARDSHYAINLALFLGSFCKASSFSVRLDVDTSLQTTTKNLILVGGPVTNLVVSQINDHLPIKFRNNGTWDIFDEVKNKSFSEDSSGIVAKIPNPYNPSLKILLFAGIRFIGTKSAVIALTNNNKELLSRYNNQKEFISVIQGFDMDGDGKIDSAEML